MNTFNKRMRVCKNGHRYYKGRDCPPCPVCEKIRKPREGFMSLLSVQARRALINNNITTLKKLSKFSENEILELYGIGTTAISILQTALESAGLNFKGQGKNG